MCLPGVLTMIIGKRFKKKGSFTHIHQFIIYTKVNLDHLGVKLSCHIPCSPGIGMPMSPIDCCFMLCALSPKKLQLQSPPNIAMQ